MKKNKGFTLSEVLITLAVIGIVAAITVPVLMQNHKRTETAARLKKIYSSLAQAIKLAETEQGAPISQWDTSVKRDGAYIYDGIAFWNKYLSKYFPINDQTQCSNGSTCNYLAQFNDGSQIVDSAYSWSGSISYLNLVIDVNGPKPPNEFARDRFRFYVDLRENPKQLISGRKIFYPRGDESYTGSNYVEKCKKEKDYCLDLIMNDGWEIKSDYPYRL